jgi:O-antigen ligase
VTLLLIALRSKSKKLGLLLIPAFAVAYFWQAGDLMRERARTIDEYRTEASAASRLEAWSAALNMIADHPLTGVGLASFGPAFPEYSDKKPREAHNTILQITAETGVIAGVAYIAIVVSSILALWRNGNRLRREAVSHPENNLYLINEATLVSFCGLVACSLFLSLQMFEVFYFLCVMTNTVLFIGREPAPQRLKRHRFPLSKPYRRLST